MRAPSALRSINAIACALLIGFAGANLFAIQAIYRTDISDPVALARVAHFASGREQATLLAGMTLTIIALFARRLSPLILLAAVAMGQVCAVSEPLSWTSTTYPLAGTLLIPALAVWAAFTIALAAVVARTRWRPVDRVFAVAISGAMLATATFFLLASAQGILMPEIRMRQSVLTEIVNSAPNQAALRCGKIVDCRTPSLLTSGLHEGAEGLTLSASSGAGNEAISASLPLRDASLRATTWFCYLALIAHTTWLYGGMALLWWHRRLAPRSPNLAKAPPAPVGVRITAERVAWAALAAVALDVAWRIVEVATATDASLADLHETLLLRMNILFDTPFLLLAASAFWRRIGPIAVLTALAGSVALAVSGLFEGPLHRIVLASGLHPVMLAFGLPADRVSNQYVKLIVFFLVLLGMALAMWRRPTFRSLDRAFLAVTCTVALTTMWLFHHFVITGILAPQFDFLVDQTRAQILADGPAGIEALCRHPDSQCLTFPAGHWADERRPTRSGVDALPEAIEAWFSDIDGFARANSKMLHVAHLLRTPITDPRSNHILAYSKNGSEAVAIVLTGDATTVRRRGEAWLSALVMAVTGVWLFGGQALLSWHRSRVARRAVYVAATQGDGVRASAGSWGVPPYASRS